MRRAVGAAVIVAIIALYGDGSKDNYQTISARSRRARLTRAPLDAVEHGLAVRVPLLVVAQLAQLGRREAVEPVLNLRRGQVVVVGDREVRGGAAAVPALLGGLEQLAAVAEHPLEVRQEIIGRA